MPGIVLDTNVVLDWLLFANAHCSALAVRLEARHIRWHATPGMRAELAVVLRHPALQHWSPSCERLLSTFDRLACIRPDIADAPLAAGLRCRDIADQMFIDLACRCGARWLLSRDRALLELAGAARKAGVEILTPAVWSKRLACSQTDAVPQWPSAR